MAKTKKSPGSTASRAPATQKTTVILLIALIACILLIIGLFFYYLYRGGQENLEAIQTDLDNQQAVEQMLINQIPQNTPAPTEVPPATPTVGLANPASVFCAEKNGTHVTLTRPDGGQYSLCQFEDNYACEEWSMMRGECPVGGIKTTGYNTPAQVYCAQTGGIVNMDADTCSKGESVCSSEAYYEGTCG